VYAGSGKNLEDARAPAFLDTPKGRIAIVGMHTPNNDNTMASLQSGNVGGRPGLNGLRYTTYHIVNQEQFDALKKIRAALYTPPAGTTNTVRLRDANPKDRLQLFGVWYQLGATPGTKTFEMNDEDLTGILRSIRNGKYFSDFMIATIHAHQGPVTAQQWLFEDGTPDFLIELAHKSIDSGADVFVGHGPHVLRGVEIYKGKPVFYGLGEFFYQWHMDASIMAGSWWNNPTPSGEADSIIDAANRVSPNWRPINYESMVAVSRYDKSRLVEVRLHPTSGQFEGPVSQLGIPRTAPPAMAERILQRVQALSKPFGTTISIEGGVGVIRIAASPATAGQ
jgi:poly-gamma-glutamate synthesis protein (capsule biosynthesis protein)